MSVQKKMDVNLILKTVQNYLKILESNPSPLVDSSLLPASKETLKKSIQAIWFVVEDPKIRSSLKKAFICLANFQANISPKFEDIFLNQELEATSDGNIIESQILRLAKENFPHEFARQMNLRQVEIKELVTEITLWEKDAFD